jgi:D-serine deaminase-like pyridoxal phosphate-dependent protein
VPPAPSTLPRLAKLSQILYDASANHSSRSTVSLLLDHIDQLHHITALRAIFPAPVPVWIKIDSGYHRAGILPGSATLTQLLAELARHRQQASDARTRLVGLYTHLGHSYAFSEPSQALDGLLTEFETLQGVLTTAHLRTFGPLTLSVGATPTATAAQSLMALPADSPLRERWTALRRTGANMLEIHAGVYPVLDMQQLATHARTSNLSHGDLALRVQVEIASLYPEREPPEALISAGSLALGREPCKSYPGWGVLCPSSSSGAFYSEESKTGWIVGRISQEHGILTWQGSKEEMRELKIGEKVMVWPNHACVTGAGFGWYFVVDSDKEGGEVVEDIWVRCRGW